MKNILGDIFLKLIPSKRRPQVIFVSPAILVTYDALIFGKPIEIAGIGFIFWYLIWNLKPLAEIFHMATYRQKLDVWKAGVVVASSV